MNTGPAGLALIRRFEGCVLTAYLDRLARTPVWTIGYGCTGPDVYEGLVITQAQAEHMLAARLAREFEPGVLEAIGDAPTTQAQFDAMVSLSWNIGVGRVDDPETFRDESAGFKGSSIAAFHRSGNHARAADAFRRWIRAGGVVREGLVRRREAERRLYLGGSIATVADVQGRLSALGWPLRVDGVAGPATCGAILAALDAASGVGLSSPARPADTP